MKALFKSIVVKILTWEAQVLLRRAKPKIVAITGTVGKTTTKDAIYTVLKNHVSARKSEKSYNTEITVPLTVLGLPNAWNNPFLWVKNICEGFFIAFFQGKYPEVLVLEMGVDRPGDMKRFTRWIKPDVVVFTRLPDVPVHVEYFASPDAVIEEKAQLLYALDQKGVFVFNNDDEKIRSMVDDVRQQAIGFSRYSPSQYHVTADKVTYDNQGIPTGLEFTLSHLDDSATVKVADSLGVQHTYNYAAAAAVGSIFDISLEDASNALADHVSPPGRMRIVKGIKDTLIIDDTYNSSPVAAERALSSLHEIQATGRKIAVLGDMLELGSFSVEEHNRVGQQVVETSDILVTVGVRSKKTAQAALEYGMDEAVIYQYDQSIEAGRELQSLIQPGDVILVKGSQSIRTERIVLDIMANPDQSDQVLVRQSKQWQDQP